VANNAFAAGQGLEAELHPRREGRVKRHVGDVADVDDAGEVGCEGAAAELEVDVASR
jgi:hypothetical protein